MSELNSSVAGRVHVALLTATEMRDWDRRALERHGVVERVLMESAGRAAAAVVQRLFPEGRVVAAVGRGNNGGDALVALRTLKAWGRDVAYTAVEGGIADPALLHGWELERLDGEADAALAAAGVLIDGLLGTGARGAPREPYAGAIHALRRAGRPIVALDGPSGVDLTLGTVEGGAVDAAVTVTFGAPKRGLLLYPGRLHAGRIVAVEIGFQPLDAGDAAAAVVTPAWARERLPAVTPNAHKGQLGDVVVVAGSRGVAGAAILVGTAAARAGAGKVYLLSTPDNREILQVAAPEALFEDRESAEAAALLERADAVVVGPGMGTDAAAEAVLRRVLATGRAPVLADADALSLMARTPELAQPAGRDLLLTPHPGEMGRLLGIDAGAVVADPFGALQRATDRFGCAVLLKGAPCLVGAPGETVMANVTGHSGIATGGMGDTLAGVVAAMLAVGASPRDAAALGLFFSGRAAELAGRGRSLLPRDVAEHLGIAFAAPDPVSALDLPGLVFDLPVPR